MKKYKTPLLILIVALIIVNVLIYSYGFFNGDATSVNDKLKNKEPVEIVALGDSLTYGYGSDVPYTDVFKENLATQYGYEDINVINKGVSGRNSQTLLEKFKEYISEDTDLVILFIGANDIFHNKDLDTKENIEKIIKWLIYKDIEVQICTYPYTKIELYFTELDEEGIEVYHNQISDLNNDIRDLSEEYEIGLVDLEKNFKELLENGTFKYDEIFSDGVHFNDLGYGIMAGYILFSIR